MPARFGQASNDWRTARVSLGSRAVTKLFILSPLGEPMFPNLVKRREQIVVAAAFFLLPIGISIFFRRKHRQTSSEQTSMLSKQIKAQLLHCLMNSGF